MWDGSLVFFLKVFIHKLIYFMPSLNIQEKKDIYLCMSFHFRCIQGYKCSCKNPQCCYNKRWHHSYRCCLNTRWCLYGDKSMRSCIFGEREDIILLFIELIRRQPICWPLGGWVCFFLRAVKRTFNDLYHLCHYSPSLINSKHWKVLKFEKREIRTLFKS